MQDLIREFNRLTDSYRWVTETYDFADVEGAKALMEALGYPFFSGKRFYKKAADIGKKDYKGEPAEGVTLKKVGSGYRVQIETYRKVG